MDVSVADPTSRPSADLDNAGTRRRDERVNWRSSIPFLVFHAVPLLAFVTGVTRTAIIMFAAVVIMLDSIRRWLGTRKGPQITQLQEPLFEKSV